MSVKTEGREEKVRLVGVVSLSHRSYVWWVWPPYHTDLLSLFGGCGLLITQILCLVGVAYFLLFTQPL